MYSSYHDNSINTNNNNIHNEIIIIVIIIIIIISIIIIIIRIVRLPNSADVGAHAIIRARRCHMCPSHCNTVHLPLKHHQSTALSRSSFIVAGHFHLKLPWCRDITVPIHYPRSSFTRVRSDSNMRAEPEHSPLPWQYRGCCHPQPPVYTHNIYIYIYIHVSLSISISIYLSIHIYIYTIIYNYTHYTHVCVCIYIYIYIYRFYLSLSL